MRVVKHRIRSPEQIFSGQSSVDRGIPETWGRRGVLVRRKWQFYHLSVYTSSDLCRNWIGYNYCPAMRILLAIDVVTMSGALTRSPPSPVVADVCVSRDPGADFGTGVSISYS